MLCEGKFMFKEIRKVDKGTFTNENGEEINYGDSYKLNVDETTEKGIKNRVFRIAKDNTLLINQCRNLKPYTEVKIKFDVDIYDTRVVLKPVSVSPIN